MPWAVAAAAVAAGATIYSSHQASKSSSQANAAEQAAADKANATQLQMYNQTRQDNMPALQARNASLAKLQDLLGIGGNPNSPGYGSLSGSINPGDVTKDPGYQFGLDQGMRGINNSLAARGMRDSGSALMAADRYGTDYATTKYDDAFNRQLQNRQQQLNPLLSVGGLAQVGTSQIGQAGSLYGQQAGNNAMYAGDAAAQNALAQGSIRGNMANQMAGWYQNQRFGAPAYNPYSDPTYGTGYHGAYVNQGPSGGDPNGSYWGTE